MEETTEELETQESVSSDAESVEVVSLKEFVEIPYRRGEWERIDENPPSATFSPLEVTVVESIAVEDTFFERFDRSLPEDRESYFHSETGEGIEVPIKPASDAEVTAVNEEQLQASYDKGFEAGKSEGISIGKIEGSDCAAENIARSVELTQEISNQAKVCFDGMEKRCVELALEVAKRILAVTVEIKPDYIVDFLKDALTKLGAATPVRVRLSADDYEFLNVVGFPPEISSSELGIEYVVDESIESGCVVETNYGEVDFELDKMWEQVKANLYEVFS